MSQPGYLGKVLEVGKGRVLEEGTDVCLLGYGTCVNRCLEAAQMLRELGVSVTVADARFCKPLDTDLVRRLAKVRVPGVTKCLKAANENNTIHQPRPSHYVFVCVGDSTGKLIFFFV